MNPPIECLCECMCMCMLGRWRIRANGNAYSVRGAVLQLSWCYPARDVDAPRPAVHTLHLLR